VCGENCVCTLGGINQIKVDEMDGEFSTRRGEKHTFDVSWKM
jgi:hypothetical protein